MDPYYEIEISCNDEVKELLIAELAELDFEGFVEQQQGFSAFVPSSLFKEDQLNEILMHYDVLPGSVQKKVIEQQNWNEEWEKQFEPVMVGNEIIIRAPFHEMGSAKHELIIQPKNTFGTGHHETTQLMLELMLETGFVNKQVLDYGCGTGVLGLFSAKLGSAGILGIDIDEWCTDNVEENKRLNDVSNFDFRKGDLGMLGTEKPFDIVLANINKNILMASFEKLSALLTDHGILLISGFYESDLTDLCARAGEYGFSPETKLIRNSWCAARLSLQKTRI